MMSRVNENVIEWVNGDKYISCTFSQKKFINRTRKLVEKHPDKIKIVAENPDGSIYVKMPLNALHLYIMISDHGFQSKTATSSQK